MKLGAVAGICGAIGVVTVVATISLGRVPENRSARVADHATEEYGKHLVADTTEVLGPDVSETKMRFMNSRLACASCHIGVGQEPGNLSLAVAMTKYPRISPRSNGNETIQDRINGCMTRSMNGRALALDSPEMKAMVSYVNFLSEQDAAMGAASKKAHEPPAFKTPNRRADLDSGAHIFEKRCAACHGKEGAGLAASTNLTDGYVFPPLWGDYSFNEGAGLHRVLTAAKFIKAKMPLGKADLDDNDAFDVAAFINSKPRPAMSGLEKDYPDLKKKPVDTGYGPYGDSFPLEQHRFGPFAPIEDYYKHLGK
jgi:thiosulfate dehydrogenase